ncbi:DNA circularization N-terminal domain-containing protein [Bradyrhizobium sp. SZCCHNS2015]|uniref:DNA circularization N-terminal domain-containing protein n=1 Tax=Bradyrhizobium sp. SZCCHNS2015 TaxID=3057305 RepID=UPI0028EE1689|nr:DNA circularization N-terminal domain-containing protein [Bradyrhizobium sp. SZCCHNS2015]
MASAEGRDWLSTLWPASYKGVPFYFETDEEEGGRNPIIHRLVNRDDPFIEDLGEEPRFYSGAAYVHGDDVDAQAVALKETLSTRGAGTLVLPLFGPVQVQALPWKRVHEKDKLGYCAFEVKFVRDGSAASLITVGFSLNQAFNAVDRMAAAIASLFPSSLKSLGQPDAVIEAATDGLASAAASLDVVRTTYQVDPAVSATLAGDIAALVSAAPGALSDSAAPGDAAVSIAADLVAATRALAAGMTPATAQAAMLDQVAAFTVDDTAAAPISINAASAAANEAASYRVARLAALTAWAEAMLRAAYPDRPAGVTARGQVAERFEVEQFNTFGADDAALYVAMEDLRGRVIDYFTRLINDLSPVIAVETAISLPSLALAWSLYADPARADELVARNRVRHPSLMPKQFEALQR